MGTSKGFLAESFLAGDTNVSWYRSWANGREIRQKTSLLERAKPKHGDGSSYGHDTVPASMRGRLANESSKRKQPFAITYYVTLCLHGSDLFELCLKSPKWGTTALQQASLSTYHTPLSTTETKRKVIVLLALSCS